MKSFKQIFVLFMFSVVSAHIAESSDPVEIKHTETGYVCVPKDRPNPLEFLPKHYKDGKWSVLQTQTGNLLEQMKNAKNLPLGINANKNFYSIVMVTDAAFDKETIVRYLYHDPPGEPFNRTLPGIEWDKDRGQLFQIVITDGSYQLGSAYEFEKEIDVQRQKELTAFVTTLIKTFPLHVDLDKVTEGFRTFAAKTKSKCSHEEFPVYAMVHAVTLVKERGTLLIGDTAVSVPNDETEKIFKQKADLIALKYKSWSTHVATVSDMVSLDVILKLKKCLNEGQGIADWSCWGQTRKTARESAERYLRANPNLAKRDMEAILIVEKELLNAIPDGSDKIEKSSSYKNVPKRHISFGLLSAATFGESKDPIRVKVDENKVVQDPLPTALTMAIVNIHPSAYDAQNEKISWSERLRFFAGATLSPEFGIGFGGGVALFRGVSLNLGYAFMLIDTEGDQKIGQEVLADEDPLGSGTAGAWFFGGSYSFD